MSRSTASVSSSAGTAHSAARAAATVGVPLVIAAALHLVLAFPDGRLAGRPRQVTVAVAYLIAAGAGLDVRIVPQAPGHGSITDSVVRGDTELVLGSVVFADRLNRAAPGMYGIQR